MSKKVKIGLTEYQLPFRYDAGLGCVIAESADGETNRVLAKIYHNSLLGETIALAFNQYFNPIEMLLFCPRCDEQHFDKAEPDICEKCGFDELDHNNLAMQSLAVHPCEKFIAWLNPPHKSHLCHRCNYVWRPADVPTSGVAALKTRGENDGTANPKEVQT